MKRFFAYQVFLFFTFVFSSLSVSQNNTSSAQFEIKTSTINYFSGSDTISAYLAEPEVKGIFPALIVIHEWWGLNDVTKHDAEEFAKKGYVALAVDLYRGKSAKDAEEAHELSRGLPEDRALRDIQAAYSFLEQKKNADKNKIGSVGWCMGGGYSLQSALNLPGLKASVICYGRLVTDENVIKKIKTPLLGIFGETDRGIPVPEVKKFEAVLNKVEAENKIIIYPGVGHAFMNPENERYNKEISEKAWNEIYTFLEENLK